MLKIHHHRAGTCWDVERKLNRLATRPLNRDIANKRGFRVVGVLNGDPEMFLTVADHAVEDRALVVLNIQLELRWHVCNPDRALKQQGTGSSTHFEIHIAQSAS